MRRKHPAFLPGKELGEIHFEPFAAAEASPETLWVETAPLWEMAGEKGWIDDTSRIKEELSRKQVKTAWGIASTWGPRLNWTRAEESGAVAGWITLRNLDRDRQIWRSCRRPCGGLRRGNTEDFRRALRLACAFEKELPENEQEGERHLLALTLLLLGRKEQELEALGREALGSSSIGATGPDKLLVISHGIQTSGGTKWARADLETIRRLSARLEKGLSDAQQSGITEWRRKLAEKT